CSKALPYGPEQSGSSRPAASGPRSERGICALHGDRHRNCVGPDRRRTHCLRFGRAYPVRAVARPAGTLGHADEAIPRGRRGSRRMGLDRPGRPRRLRELHRHRLAGVDHDRVLPGRPAPLPCAARPDLRGPDGGAAHCAGCRGVRAAKLFRRRQPMKTSIAVAVAVLAILGAGAAHAQGTLEAVQKKGFVQCGVNGGAVAGFSAPDSQGVWKGLDVDLCRAVAAAVFGDANKVRYTGLTAQQRFTALQSGEVDILSRNTTWTITRDTSLGLNFVGVNFYDGQGFMVPTKMRAKGGKPAAKADKKGAAKGAAQGGITSAKQLNGATVCVQPGTTTELNLSDYFRANGMTFKPVVIETLPEVLKAYFSGRCDVFTTDVSGLVSSRASRAPKPDEHIILPEVISKEPLGPAVRHGDDRWFDIVKWSL